MLTAAVAGKQLCPALQQMVALREAVSTRGPCRQVTR